MLQYKSIQVNFALWIEIDQWFSHVRYPILWPKFLNPQKHLRLLSIITKVDTNKFHGCFFLSPNPIIRPSSLGHKNFTNSTPKSLSTLPKHCPSKINPRAKFNLSEILGGRGLCNGVEGLQQELENDISKEVEKTAPLPSSSSSSSLEEKKTQLLQVPGHAFEKELLGLTGDFPGGEKGLKKFIEKNPSPKKGKILKGSEFDAKMAKAGVLFEGGNWDRLVTFRLEELERRKKGPPMVSPISVVLEKMVENNS